MFSGEVKTERKHKKITDFTQEEFETFFNSFRESLYGHEKFKDDFYDIAKSFRLFNKIGEHKVLSLFLLGESGVGKTEVARALYKCLGGEENLAKVNFGNYSNEFSLSSLILEMIISFKFWIAFSKLIPSKKSILTIFFSSFQSWILGISILGILILGISINLVETKEKKIARILENAPK